MSNTELKDNPYVAIVARKHRNLKKKLEKIVKLELNVASGKSLDEEQLILCSSKNSVEKAIADIGQLKDQLEEVSAQELALAEASKVVVSVESTTEEVSTETFAIEQSSISTQYETAEETKVPVIESHSPIIQVVTVPVVDAAVLENSVKKLLKVFHVCMKYTATTGQRLPSNVDYFGQTLLGQTSLGGFEVALEGSLRSAGTYLNDELSTQEFMRGFSYSQMADLVDSLAHDMSLGNNNLSFASLSGAVDKLQQVSSPAPQTPIAAPEEVAVETLEIQQEQEFVEQPVQVVEEIPTPVVVQESTRKPPARERGPPRVSQHVEDLHAAPAEHKKRGPRARTPRERTRQPVAAGEHAPEHQTGKRDFGSHVPKPVHDVAVEEHAARHLLNRDNKDSRLALCMMDDRKRGPLAPRNNKPREVTGEAPVVVAEQQTLTQSAEAAVTVKAVHSGPPAKVWGGDNKIKAVHSIAPATEAAKAGTRPNAGPSNDHAAVNKERAPRPAVRNVTGGAAPSSGDRFRNNSNANGPRPSRPPRDPAASAAASGDASSGPPPARRPQTSNGGAPRPPRPSGSGAPGGERRPQTARPPASKPAAVPVAATA